MDPPRNETRLTENSGQKKHVTTACAFCRRRKIKCDGNIPVCSNCQTSKQACVYDVANDKRKIPLRKVTASLTTRLAQLEELLQSHNIELPPSSQGAQDELELLRSAAQGEGRSKSKRKANQKNQNVEDSPLSAMEALGGLDEVGALADFSIEALPTQLDETPVLNPDEAHSFDIQLPDSGSASTLPMNQLSNGALQSIGSHARQNNGACVNPQSPIVNLNQEAQDQEPDGIEEYLSARMGSLQIAEDGQLRYYGPTSNLHIYHNGLLSLSRSSIRTVATEGRAALQRAELDAPTNPDIETHLARLYFAWEDPAIHVVDEEVFFAEKQRWLAGDFETSYYSETLNNAM